MSTEDDTNENLPKIFQEGLDLFNLIDKTDEATNSLEVQDDIRKAMDFLEKATNLASIGGLFSTNESIDEIATADLQYLMLPALLGTLSLKITSGNRKEIVECAEIYFKDFLQRANDYGLTDYTYTDETLAIASGNRSEIEQIKGMVVTRQNKIQRFKDQKELQRKLDELKVNMGSLNVDDEIKRSYLLTMIKIFIYKSIEEIASIKMEKPMLEHMEKVKKEDGGASISKREIPKPSPLKPVIITKDQLQKAVFGLGYPSLPTMTVKEFYDQRVRDGVFPDPSNVQQGSMSLQEQALAGIERNDEPEEIENEARIEQDDPDMLQSLRDKDEFKDDHRRGWGNRMNRS